MILWLWVSLSIAAAAPLKFDQVQETVTRRMPLIMEAMEKKRAAEGVLESQEGAFDHKIKFKSMNQIEDKYDNQVFETKLERQTPWMGSRMFVGHRQGTGLFASYDGKYETSSLGELFAGVDVPLLRDRSIDEFRLNRLKSFIEVQKAEVDLQQKRLDVLFKAAQVFWKWTMAGQKLRILQSWVKQAEDRQQFLEKKVKAGDTSEIKLTDNRRTLLKRQADVVKVRRDFEMASAELALYINRIPSLEEVKTEIKLSEDKIDIPQSSMRDQLPPFKLVKLEEQILEQEREFAISQQLPDLRLAVEGARDVGAQSQVSGGQDQLRVGVMLEIPLENRKGKGKREEVAGKKAALNYRREWLEREWEARIKQNAQALTTTRQQLNLQQSEVADTSKMARAEMTRFNQGDSDIFFVNIREQDEAEAQVRLIETEALHELMVAERRLLDGQWLNQSKFESESKKL
jgi:cobalt-zinc-cadmium efflux system outer membrane protein